jgi:putative membrane protein insertion efficiency factor
MELNGLKQNKIIIFNYIPIFFITIYRLLFARFFFGNCRFIPSCSEYAIEAFKKFNFFKAFKISFFRILRCHPFGSHGYDPINDKEDFLIKKVPASYIKKFRIIALYRSKQKKSAVYKEDSKKNTKHYLLFINKKVVSGLTLIKDVGSKKYQIRGMFTLPKFRAMGYGSKLLRKIEFDNLNKNKHFKIWCNARIEAVDFYKKNNYKIVGEEFLIKNIGLHYRMEKNYEKKFLRK